MYFKYKVTFTWSKDGVVTSVDGDLHTTLDRAMRHACENPDGAEGEVAHANVSRIIAEDSFEDVATVFHAEPNLDW